MTPRMFYTLARVLAALTVIPFHEAGHALAAWLLGDPTAKQQGRLSLNRRTSASAASARRWAARSASRRPMALSASAASRTAPTTAPL